MSDANQIAGEMLYLDGDDETRAWFERQWSMWPERADARYTTNISFHHGGVRGFRRKHGRAPVLSRDFREHVEFLDRQA